MPPQLKSKKIKDPTYRPNLRKDPIHADDLDPELPHRPVHGPRTQEQRERNREAQRAYRQRIRDGTASEKVTARWGKMQRKKALALFETKARITAREAREHRMHAQLKAKTAEIRTLRKEKEAVEQEKAELLKMVVRQEIYLKGLYRWYVTTHRPPMVKADLSWKPPDALNQLNEWRRDCHSACKALVKGNLHITKKNGN